MNIQINQTFKEHGAQAININVEGQEVSIYDNGIDSVNILVKNASHSAFRGMGKYFKDLKEALNNYKSKKVRAAIEYVIQNGYSIV